MKWLLDKFDHALSWAYISRMWGKRCPDYWEHCQTCRRWEEHDWYFNGGVVPKPSQPIDGQLTGGE